MAFGAGVADDTAAVGFPNVNEGLKTLLDGVVVTGVPFPPKFNDAAGKVALLCLPKLKLLELFNVLGVLLDTASEATAFVSTPNVLLRSFAAVAFGVVNAKVGGV